MISAASRAHRRQRRYRVGEDIAAADDALVGTDVDEQQGRRRDRADRGADRPRERRVDRAELDVADGEYRIDH